MLCMVLRTTHTTVIRLTRIGRNAVGGHGQRPQPKEQKPKVAVTLTHAQKKNSSVGTMNNPHHHTTCSVCSTTKSSLVGGWRFVCGDGYPMLTNQGQFFPQSHTHRETYRSVSTTYYPPCCTRRTSTAVGTLRRSGT